MLVRVSKTRDGIEYAYIVEAYRDELGRSRQRVIERHGRLEVLLAADPDALVKLKQRAKELMVEAKKHAAEIVNQAQKRAAEIVEEAKDSARAEGERLVTAAKAEIDQETNRAREALREKVAELALAAATKILNKEIDASAHKALVDTFAKQI